MDDHPDIRVFCFRETKNRPIFLLFYYLPRGSKEKFFAFFGGLRKGVPVATISFGTHTSLENVAPNTQKKNGSKIKILYSINQNVSCLEMSVMNSLFFKKCIAT